MDCKNCNGKTPTTVPYAVVDGTRADMMRIVRWLCWVIVLLISLLVGSNAMWFYHESQMEDVVVTQEVDTESGSAVVSGVGDLYYGEGQTNR